MIPNMTTDEAIRICRRFGQDSIIHGVNGPEGMQYEYWESPDGGKTYQKTREKSRYDVMDRDAEDMFSDRRGFKFQIPFFGFPTGFRNCRPFSAVGQLDLRYRFNRKNYFTARGGIFMDDYDFGQMFQTAPTYAFGLEFARQTLFGPLNLAAQWCNITGFTVYASIGFAF